MFLYPWLPICLPVWDNEFLWLSPFLQFVYTNKTPSNNCSNLSHECFLFGSAKIETQTFCKIICIFLCEASKLQKLMTTPG